jgi:hypothetical protein
MAENRKELVRLVSKIQSTLSDGKFIFTKLFNILVEGQENVYTHNINGVFINLLEVNNENLQTALNYAKHIEDMEKRNVEIETLREQYMATTKIKKEQSRNIRTKVVEVEDIDSGEELEEFNGEIERLKPKKINYKGVYLRLHRRLLNRRKKEKEEVEEIEEGTEDVSDTESLSSTTDAEQDDEETTVTTRKLTSTVLNYDYDFI